MFTRLYNINRIKRNVLLNIDSSARNLFNNNSSNLVSSSFTNRLFTTSSQSTSSIASESTPSLTLTTSTDSSASTLASTLINNYLCNSTPNSPYDSKLSKTTLINSLDQLTVLYNSIDRSSRIAVDTEFMSSKYYLSSLELIQIATTDYNIYIIDCRLLELKSKGTVTNIIKKIIVKPLIIHAARLDLQLLQAWTNERPKYVFDTQIVADIALINEGPGVIGLATLSHSLLQVKMDKSYTMSSWNARPLNEGQIKYAADDVRYLFEMQDLMVKKIIDMNRLHMFKNVTKSMKLNFEPPSPLVAWKNVSKTKFTSPEEYCILKELAEWRETAASKRNINSPSFLSNDSLIAIVLIASDPVFSSIGGDDKVLTSQMVARINSIQYIKGSTVFLFKTDIVKAIRKGWELSSEFKNLPDKKTTILEFLDVKCGVIHTYGQTARIKDLPPKKNILLELVNLYLRQVAIEYGVSFKVLTDDSKQEVINLVNYTKDELTSMKSIFTSTWRNEIISDDVFLISQGLVSLQWDEDQSKIILVKKL